MIQETRDTKETLWLQKSSLNTLRAQTHRLTYKD